MSLNTLVAIQGGGSQEATKPAEYIDQYLDDIYVWYEGNFGLTTTSWKDASGNNRDLSRISTSNINEVVEFNNTGINSSKMSAGSVAGWSYSDIGSYFGTNMANGYTYFLVCRHGDAIGQLIQSGTMYWVFNHYISSDVTGFQKMSIFDGEDTSNVSNIAYDTGDYLLITFYGSSFFDLNMLFNGDTATINSATSTGISDTSTAFVLGGTINNSFVEIAESIVCDNEFALSKRQEFEGYLAHKWGLEGQLPGGHPYKSSPPS